MKCDMPLPFYLFEIPAKLSCIAGQFPAAAHPPASKIKCDSSKLRRFFEFQPVHLSERPLLPPKIGGFADLSNKDSLQRAFVFLKTLTSKKPLALNHLLQRKHPVVFFQKFCCLTAIKLQCVGRDFQAFCNDFAKHKLLDGHGA